MWQHNVFFDLDVSLTETRQWLHLRQLHVNETAVADIDEPYSNTKNGTSYKNSNVIDLLTILTKSPIPDTWSQALILSLEDE